MALTQPYALLWFESFRLQNTSGHRYPIQLKLQQGQQLTQLTIDTCKAQSRDPFSLVLECSTNLLTDYLVGTRFLVKAKLTDREGSGLYFYTFHKWQPVEIRKT